MVFHHNLTKNNGVSICYVMKLVYFLVYIDWTSYLCEVCVHTVLQKSSMIGVVGVEIGEVKIENITAVG